MGLGGIDKQLVFKVGARQGLFAVDVNSFLDGPHRDGEMGEVGSRDHYGVNLAVHLVEHLPEILVALGVGIVAHHLLGVGSAHVHVA